MHKRKEIRERVVELLMENTDAGANVFPHRVLPLFKDSEIPAICVYTDVDRAADATGEPDFRDQTLSLIIEVVANHDERAEDVLDAISAQIDQIMFDNFKSVAVWHSNYFREAKYGLTEKGERVYGACIMSFDVMYQAVPAEPTLDTFDTGYVDLDGKEAEGDPEGPRVEGEFPIAQDA